MALKLVTPAGVEPVLLTDLKSHLRLDTTLTLEDTLLAAFITAAREYCELCQGRAYITQTWDLLFDDWPPSPFKIPLPPLQKINSIKYIDSAKLSHTVAPADYEYDIYSLKGRVSLVPQKTWPAVTLQALNAIEVNFDAGYGAAGANVPERIRTAIMLLAGNYYEHREATDIKVLHEIKLGVHALLGLDPAHVGVG